MTRAKKILVFGGIGVALVAIVGLNAAKGGDRKQEVRIETAELRPLVSTVTASGQIQPQTSVDVSSDITGRIISIPVKEGDWVRRGDLVLLIEPSEFEANVARAQAALASAEASALQARANRDQARRALERATALKEQNANLVSDEQLEQAQTQFEVSEAIATSASFQVEQARASLTQAREQLAKTVLRAPMSGEITRLAVEEGEVAVPGTFSRETGLLMTISDLSVIQVNVRVDETDVVRLHLGDSTEIIIDAFVDSTFAGRVTKISKSAVRAAAASAGTNQAVDYEVEVTLDNPPAEVRPDLSATARIVTATRDSALSIPIIALTVREHTALSTEANPQDTTAGKKEVEGVFVIREGRAEFRPVHVGIAGEEYFEVLEGLSVGDSIAAGPYQTIRDLKDGTAVRPSATSTTSQGSS
ncbi:MAG TPA: efflux RND transporter periplasmic adaptor subunit [Gemmatimonadales bacterium]|jgi:HlyD family secretion protein